MAKVLMKGNEAIAEAAINAGCLYYFGYPITPQTEIAEYMARRMPKVGGLCLQAESEIAAVNMLLGASASGTRAMTSSSSPGISLKSEGISYLVGSDLPAVVVNVQRGGPGLGGIQPSQADYYQATKAYGHGDMHLIVLAPSTVQEMASLTGEAFDLADIYRTPVVILADGAIGQMMEPVDFSEKKRREVPPKDWAACGHGGARRHNIINSLFMDPEDLERTVLERFERYRRIEETEVQCEHYMTDDADIVVVAFGIAARVARTAVSIARSHGVKAGLLRPITLWPFPVRQIRSLADTAKAFLSVELSMGQMVTDVKLACECRRPVDFYGRTGGVIPAPADVAAKIEAMSREICRELEI